jgi:hypothetical protein
MTSTALEPAGNPDRQAFMGELVDDIEHAILSSVMGVVLEEVISATLSNII